MSNRNLTANSGWNALLYTIGYWIPKYSRNTRRAIRAIQSVQQVKR